MLRERCMARMHILISDPGFGSPLNFRHVLPCIQPSTMASQSACIVIQQVLQQAGLGRTEVRVHGPSAGIRRLIIVTLDTIICRAVNAPF